MASSAGVTYSETCGCEMGWRVPCSLPTKYYALAQVLPVVGRLERRTVNLRRKPEPWMLSSMRR